MMPEYCLFCLDDAGRIIGAAEIKATGDDEAIKFATAFIPTICQLWKRNRLIAKIPVALETSGRLESALPLTGRQQQSTQVSTAAEFREGDRTRAV